MISTDKIYLRAEFRDQNPECKILDGRATYFTEDYVNWLEKNLLIARKNEGILKTQIGET